MTHMKIIQFDWDRGNWPKCGKHGVSKKEIERLFVEGHPRVAPAPAGKQATDHEGRHIAVGRIDGRAMFVVFVLRGGFIRPISARYMHAQEARNYEKST